MHIAHLLSMLPVTVAFYQAELISLIPLGEAIPQPGGGGQR